MRHFVLAFILCPPLLLPATGTARANPLFSQAITDRELAAASAGTAIVFQVREEVQQSVLAPTAISAPFPSLFGIQTIVLDKGVGSVSQAATMVSFKATLAGF